MSYLRSALWCAAIGFSAARAIAADAPASLLVHFEQSGRPLVVRGSLRLTPVSGKGLDEVLVEGSRITLVRPAGSLWTLELVSETHWAAPRVVSFPEAGQSRDESWPAWPLANVTARLSATTPADEVPSVLTEAPPAPLAQPEVPAGVRLRCSLGQERRLQCASPTAAVDLVIRAPGCAPLYRSLRVSNKGPNELGELPCKQGASLVAWINPKSFEAASEIPRARLLRMLAGPSATSQNLQSPVADAPFERNGRVQLVPLPPGVYILEVRAKPFAPARAFPLEIFAGRESVLRKALELQHPLTLHVSVEPPTDPREKPWRVELRRRSEVSNSYDADPLIQFTDAAGRFKGAGLAPGHYALVVKDSLGNVFDRRQASVASAADATINIAIPVTTVRGRVTYDDGPVAATLWFGTRHGKESIRVSADEQGNFSSALPRSGDWLLEFQSANPQTHGVVKVTVTGAELSVKIPVTTLEGSVRRADGSPAAEVEVSALAGPTPIITTTASDGSFRFSGLKSGEVAVRARDRRTGQGSRSKVVTLQPGDIHRGVVLALEESTTVTGQVVSRGLPVVGARITGYSFVHGSAQNVQGVSNHQGQFKLVFAVASSKATVVVGAPARTLQSFVVDLDGSPIVLDVQPVGGTLRLQLPNGVPLLNLFQANVAVPMPDLLAWAQAHGQAPQEGWLTVPHLAPAPYRACTLPTNSAARLSCVEGTLVPGATLELGLKR